MTKPKGALIYDPFSNKLSYDPSSGKEIYASTARTPGALSFSAVYHYQKDGYSTVSFADAVSVMESTAWLQTIAGPASIWAWNNSDTEWATRAYCWRFDCTVLYDLKDDSALSVSGESCIRIKFPIQEILGSVVWKIGVQTSNSSTPTNDWSWVTGATSTTGTTEGWFYLNLGAVLGNYLYLIASMDTYTDPGTDTTNRYYSLLDDQIKLSF